MYRSNLDSRDKAGAIAAVVVIHALLLLALLHINGKMGSIAPDSAIRVFDLRDVPPPPPPPPPQVRRPTPKDKEGGSAPENIRSEATPVVAPTPKIVLPPLPQVTASETPRLGTAATQGAADVPGPGTGAGGFGNGTGNGRGGTGPGGDGGVAEPPHLVTPVLRGRDIPRDTLDQWPRGSTVFMRLRVDDQGFVAECTIDRGTGLAVIDTTLCNLAHERLRFRPAMNRYGQAVAGWFGYAQPAPR